MVIANPTPPGIIVPPLASLSGPQDALDARETDTTLAVYLGGVLTPYLSYAAQHAVGETATGRITLALPRPPQIVANASVVVQGGHNDLVGTIFSGTIRRWDFAMSDRGDILTLTLAGASRRMHEPLRRDIVFAGPVRADAIFVALCQAASVTAYIAEVPTFISGEPLMLGGNPQIDDGAVTIKAHSSPLGQFQRLIDPYGYAVSDTPMGPPRFHRVSGTPTGTPVVSFREGPGGHLGPSRRVYDFGEIVNVWKIIGQTYTDTTGGTVPIESIADPASVPEHPEIEDGYRYREQEIGDIVRQDQAAAVRARYEVDFGDTDDPVTWEAVAVPGVAPGDVVAVASETLETDAQYWLRSLDVTDDDDGLMATYEGWAGGGIELPGIIDRITLPIQAEAWHGGDETVPWYKHPAPQGSEKVWSFTLPERASAVNVRGWHHSWNSQTVAGEDTDLTVTRWQIWLASADRTAEDAEPETSGTMPQMPERYGERPAFATFRIDDRRSPGDDGYVLDPGEWSPFSIPLKSLDPGDYKLVLACGEKAGLDDGEVIAVYLEIWGSTEAAGYEEVA
jgi:hypothetical protein